MNNVEAGGEIPKLGLFHNLEFGLLTTYIDEEDDIGVRLATLDRSLMIHSFKNLTLEDLEDEDERMEGSKSEYFPQYVCPSNEGRQDLFGEWKDNIECLDGYAFNKLVDMEVDGESPNYMDEDPWVLVLKEEGTHWELATIVEAMTELKNWAWEGATHPKEDLLEKFKITEPFTPIKNIVSISIESVSTSIVILVESVCDNVSSPTESIPVEFVKNSSPHKIISNSTYLLTLMFLF